MKKVLTLAFPVQEGKVLLGLKKRGFGAGLYNGFGGKLEAGETIEAGMKRELLEEVALGALQYMKRGVLTFYYPTQEMEVHVFEVTEYLGVPVESEEMSPWWYRPMDLPFSQMWPDDAYWLPLFLEGKSFVGKFWFGEEVDVLGRPEILRHELSELHTCYFT